MGYAIAEAARDRGANVTLITAPTSIAKPVGVEIISVETAEQMKEAVARVMPQNEVLIMAAAVADYRAASTSAEKIKKENGGLIWNWSILGYSG
jgi:phosphopantothenoylcysteine decarboxylase/phosphopantothenate--cysteine ligase